MKRDTEHRENQSLAEQLEDQYRKQSHAERQFELEEAIRQSEANRLPTPL